MIDRMMMAKMVAAFLLVVPAGKVRAESAQDYWPAWRGPTASGVSTTPKPPLTWSETQNIKRPKTFCKFDVVCISVR